MATFPPPQQNNNQLMVPPSPPHQQPQQTFGPSAVQQQYGNEYSNTAAIATRPTRPRTSSNVSQHSQRSQLSAPFHATASQPGTPQYAHPMPPQPYRQYSQGSVRPPSSSSINGSPSTNQLRRPSLDSRRSYRSYQSSRSVKSSKSIAAEREAARRPTFGDSVVLLWDSVRSMFSHAARRE